MQYFKIYVLFTLQIEQNAKCIVVYFNLQHPPEETSKGSTRKLEYAGQLPRLSTVEKNFLAQLITNPTKEVNVTWYEIETKVA